MKQKKNETKLRLVKEYLDDICAHDVVAYFGSKAIIHPFEKKRKVVLYFGCIRCDQSIVVDHTRCPYTTSKSTLTAYGGNIYPIWQKPTLRYDEDE